MTSQPKIMTFANEISDKIFGQLANKDEWLALCKTHRSFKSSAQQLLFHDIQVPAQHVAGSTGRCSQLSGALTAAPHLVGSVRALQIDFQLEGAYPYGHLILEQDAIRAILASIPSLQHLTVFIVEQPQVFFEQMDASSQLAQM
jgi:hypothetical protein